MKLHPDAVPIVEAALSHPAISESTPDEARQRLKDGRLAMGPGADIASVRDASVSSEDNDVSVRIYTPTPPAKGIVFHVHGGGWVIGCVDDFDTYGRELCSRTNCVVVMPEYRLAPENPFPAGLRDVEAVLRWVDQNRKALTGDGASPLIVAGDSAGANLATVALAGSAGRIPVNLQVLYYPVVDCDFERASYRAYGQNLPLKAPDMVWFFQNYAPAEMWCNPKIAPLRGSAFGEMPPTLVVTAEYDVLLDEGRAYADALKASGTPVIYREVRGLPHGFIRWHNICRPSDEELDLLAKDIRKACEAT